MISLNEEDFVLSNNDNEQACQSNNFNYSAIHDDIDEICNISQHDVPHNIFPPTATKQPLVASHILNAPKNSSKYISQIAKNFQKMSLGHSLQRPLPLSLFLSGL